MNCSSNVQLRILLVLFGVGDMVTEVFISFMWVMYTVVGWSVQRLRQKYPNTEHMNHQKTWPVCPLRLSTKVFFSCLLATQTVGTLVGNVRLVYLLITGMDVRLLIREGMCRMHVWISFSLRDEASWFAAVMYAERLYIMLRPTSSYSRGHQTKVPIVSIISTLLITGALINLNILLPSEKICSGPYFNSVVHIVKLVSSSVLPIFLMVLSVIGVLWKLLLIHRKQQLMRAISHAAEEYVDRSEQSSMTPSAVVSARLMIFSASLLTTLVICQTVLTIIFPRYCCGYTIPHLCTTLDYIYVGVNMFMRFTGIPIVVSILLGSEQMRHDLWVILVKCLKAPLNCCCPSFLFSIKTTHGE